MMLYSHITVECCRPHTVDSIPPPLCLWVLLWFINPTSYLQSVVFIFQECIYFFTFYDCFIHPKWCGTVADRCFPDRSPQALKAGDTRLYNMCVYVMYYNVYVPMLQVIMKAHSGTHTHHPCQLYYYFVTEISLHPAVKGTLWIFWPPGALLSNVFMCWSMSTTIHLWQTELIQQIFRKAHTCVFKVPQFTLHVKIKKKPWSPRTSL